MLKFLFMILISCYAVANPSYFLFVEDEKCYIDPENVSIQDGEIKVLSTEGETLSLMKIYRDEKGLFTTPDAVRSSDNETIWNILYCNTCKDYTTVNIRGLCSVCGNPHSKKDN